MTRRTTDRSSREGQILGMSPIILGAILVGVIGLGVLLFLNIRGPAPIQGVVTFNRQDRGHDPNLVYDLGEYGAPPAGGQHNPVWQDCAIYDEPVPIENVLHSLEHGAVWVTYRPDLPADQVEILEDLVRGESYALLSPYPGLRSPIVLTAWQVQLDVESAADRRVERFVQRYQIGEFTPERGASCENGNNASMDP